MGEATVFGSLDGPLNGQIAIGSNLDGTDHVGRFFVQRISMFERPISMEEMRAFLAETQQMSQQKEEGH